jgi:limonene 1,2-monooxygenase
VKYGFFFMPMHRPSEDPTLAIEADLQTIQRAEELGFDEVWIGEHHTAGWENIASPEMLLAAASQRTKRILLGTGVLTAPFHHPADVAERIALLDHLTRGRVMLGMGPGILPTDVKMFGLTSQTARERLYESVEILTQLLHTDEPVTYHGEHYQLDDFYLQLRPYQDKLPLALTTSGPASSSTDLAGKLGCSMISGNFFGTSGVELGTHFDGLEKAAASHGMTTSRENWRVATYIYVGESREQAYNEIRERGEAFLKDYFMEYVPPLKKVIEDYDGQPTEEITIEQIARKAHWIVGDPDEVTAGIRQLEADTGGIGSLLVIGGTASHRDWLANMERFANYVIPQLRGTNKGMQRSFQRVLENPIQLGGI